MAMRSNHGDWHIILQNMSEDEAKQIIDSSDVAYSSWYDDINVNADQGYYINGKMLCCMVLRKLMLRIL